MHLGALHPRRSLVPICLGHNHNRHSRLSHQQQHLPTSMRSNSSHSSSRAAATTTIPRHLIYSNDICDAKGLSSTTQTHAHIRNRDDVLMMFIDYYLLLNWLLNQPQLFRLPPPPPLISLSIYILCSFLIQCSLTIPTREEIPHPSCYPSGVEKFAVNAIKLINNGCTKTIF